ncbi:helix-turn-helix domain-containing protein [Cupriavidus basilensis]
MQVNNHGSLTKNNWGYIVAPMKTLGERVRYARKEKRLTQAELAKLVGVSQPMIRKIEAGSETSKTVALAIALGVRPEWLASGAGEMFPTEIQPLAVNAWPFSSVTPQRWASLPDGVRIRAESLAEGAIREWEANNPEAPVKPAHAKSGAA